MASFRDHGPGRSRVQAICGFVRGRVRFDFMQAIPARQGAGDIASIHAAENEGTGVRTADGQAPRSAVRR